MRIYDMIKNEICLMHILILYLILPNKNCLKYTALNILIYKWTERESYFGANVWVGSADDLSLKVWG